MIHPLCSWLNHHFWWFMTLQPQQRPEICTLRLQNANTGSVPLGEGIATTMGDLSNKHIGVSICIHGGTPKWMVYSGKPWDPSYPKLAG